MKLLGGGFHQGLPQKNLRQKSPQTNYRIDHRRDQRGRASVDFRNHHHFQVLGFFGNIGIAFHQHGGVDAFHLQVVGKCQTFVDGHIAAHKVKRKTFRKHIPEVQRQAARQRLQTEHSQQFGQARVSL